MSTEVASGHAVGVAMKRKEDPRFLQGKGHYVDDLTFPGMLYLGTGAQPVPTRRDQEHRHHRGDEGPGREGGDHRKGSRGGRPRLAADLPRLRQADGARDRQGALSSIRRSRPCSPIRAKRPPMEPKRCRSITGRSRSWPIRSRRRPTRCCSVRIASRRRITSFTGKWATRTRRHARWHRVRGASSSASGSSGAIRRRSNRADASRISTRWGGCSSTSRRRRRTCTAQRSRSSPVSPRTRFTSSHRISAEASATRCRCIPDTSAPSSARSRSVGRSSGSRRAPRT